MEDVVILVLEAQNDSKKLNNLIEKYLPFIKSCVAKERAAWQSREDALTLAMLAFTDSVKTYRPERGQFVSYAQTSIRNRLIDDYRSELKHSSRNVLISQMEKGLNLTLEGRLSAAYVISSNSTCQYKSQYKSDTASRFRSAARPD